MAARREVEPHEHVAGLHQRQEHALIGLDAGIGLDVGELAGEQLAGALDRQPFRDVDELAAAVIAPAGIAFGVFVGQHRPLRLQHSARDDVFRGDQLDLVALAAESRDRPRARFPDRRRRARRKRTNWSESGGRRRRRSWAAVPKRVSWANAERSPGTGRRIAWTEGGGQRRGMRSGGWPGRQIDRARSPPPRGGRWPAEPAG